MLRKFTFLLALSTFTFSGVAFASLPSQASVGAEIERQLAAELETPEAQAVADEAARELDIAAQDAETDETQVASNSKKFPVKGSGGNRCRVLGGKASWYGPGFHGRQTANGERFNQGALTAAHRSFPHNTLVKITNAENGKSVTVRINDRGPFVQGRDMDLSLASFVLIRS